MITINQETKTALILLLASTDNDLSRISIADNELNETVLILWLEDKQDFKNSLEECVAVNIPVEEFAKYIRDEELNAYQGTKERKDHSIYKCMIEINEPIDYYLSDATAYQQRFIREELVRAIFKQILA